MQALILYVENETQIAAALKLVQKWDVDFAVSGGRHSYIGASSTDGIVIGSLIWIHNRSVADFCRSSEDEKDIVARHRSLDDRSSRRLHS